MARLSFGWSCSTSSPSARSFAMTAAGNDLDCVAVSSASCVEDLRSTGTKKQNRKRTIRHRAQKRSRTYKSAASDVEFPALSTCLTPMNVIFSTLVSYKDILTTPKPMPTPSITYESAPSEPEPVSEPTVCLQTHPIIQPFRKFSAPRKSTVSPSPKSLAARQTSRPIVDVHRDRRRRLSSIKKHMVGTMSLTVSKPQLNKEILIGKKTKSFEMVPMWLRFGFVWNCTQNFSSSQILVQ